MAKVPRYIDALSLRAKQINDQVRELIDHPGEKGRAAEHVVRGLIREILPKKFSIGTGFVVTASDRRSAQMDIVLFDEQVNAPISLVGDLSIFPIECVYATLEVKTALSRQNLREAAVAMGNLRTFKEEKRYIVMAIEGDEAGRIVRLNPNAVVSAPLADKRIGIATRGFHHPTSAGNEEFCLCPIVATPASCRSDQESARHGLLGQSSGPEVIAWATLASSI